MQHLDSRCREEDVAEREEISRGAIAGLSVRAIARTLGRPPCTVIREFRRNGGRRAYRANAADQAAWDRAQRPKRCKLARNPALARVVADKLQLEWSPHQVAAWLKRTYPQDEPRQVSHERIYRTLFIQARGALKKELLAHLRRARGMRRSRHHTQKTPDHGRITETVSIRERPAEVEDRAVPGHWEGDLFFGSHFPKGMDLSDIGQSKLNAIARRLNERPRENAWFRVAGRTLCPMCCIDQLGSPPQSGHRSSPILIQFCDRLCWWRVGTQNSKLNHLSRWLFQSPRSPRWSTIAASISSLLIRTTLDSKTKKYQPPICRQMSCGVCRKS
jgi:IS30 family transposase